MMKPLIVFLFAQILLSGQISSSTGAIQGIVTYPQNAAVSGATVFLTKF